MLLSRVTFPTYGCFASDSGTYEKIRFVWDNCLLLHPQAQTHARKASKANTPTAAIDEHDLAAGQFATAANGTHNSEVQASQDHKHSQC